MIYQMEISQRTITFCTAMQKPFNASSFIFSKAKPRFMSKGERVGTDLSVEVSRRCL